MHLEVCVCFSSGKNLSFVLCRFYFRCFFFFISFVFFDEFLSNLDAALFSMLFSFSFCQDQTGKTFFDRQCCVERMLLVLNLLQSVFFAGFLC